MTNKLFKTALDDIAENVKGRRQLRRWPAKAHPEVFPPVYLGMLESAERNDRETWTKSLDQFVGLLGQGVGSPPQGQVPR